MVDEEETVEQIKERKFVTLQEVRKSLPIFKFRDRLLEAVDQCQVNTIEPLST